MSQACSLSYVNLHIYIYTYIFFLCDGSDCSLSLSLSLSLLFLHTNSQHLFCFLLSPSSGSMPVRSSRSAILPMLPCVDHRGDRSSRFAILPMLASDLHARDSRALSLCHRSSSCRAILCSSSREFLKPAAYIPGSRHSCFCFPPLFFPLFFLLRLPYLGFCTQKNEQHPPSCEDPADHLLSLSIPAKE